MLRIPMFYALGENVLRKRMTPPSNYPAVPPMPIGTMWNALPRCLGGIDLKSEDLHRLPGCAPACLGGRRKRQPSGSHLGGDADRVAVVVPHDSSLDASCRRPSAADISRCRRQLPAGARSWGRQCKTCSSSASRVLGWSVMAEKLGDQLLVRSGRSALPGSPADPLAFSAAVSSASVREEIQRFVPCGILL